MRRTSGGPPLTLLFPIGTFLAAIALALWLARRSRVLTIPILLLAGVAAGPHAFGLLHPGPVLDVSNEIGLTLLLFYTALFARPDTLRRGGRVALPLAAYDLTLNVAAAYWIGALFGLDAHSRLLLAGVLATSSTSAILKILGDEGRIRAREGQILITLLWIEDLVFIAYYILISGRSRLLNPDDAAGAVVALGAFLGFLVLVRALREPLWRIRSAETLVPLTMAIGLAGAGLGHLAGLPMAGAAFTTGLVLAGDHGARFVSQDAPYLREGAAAVFFVGFGALLDPTVTQNALPLAATAILAVVATELLFVPQVARILGLAARESLVLGSSLVARGGKSASFARLDAGTSSAQIQSIAGLLTLILTPLAPVLVRLLTRSPIRRTRSPIHREVVSRLSRGILIPTPYRQKNLVPWTDRAALICWTALPFLLGVFASLVPYAFRVAPALLGIVAIVPAYQALRDYVRRIPGTPQSTHRNRGLPMPRIERYLPPILMAPAVLALVLPLAAPWATTAFPILAAVLLVVLLTLPLFVHPHRAVPYWQQPEPIHGTTDWVPATRKPVRRRPFARAQRQRWTPAGRAWPRPQGPE